MKRVRVTESHDRMDRVNRTRLVESSGARDDSPSWNVGRAEQGGTIQADGRSPRSRRQEDVKQSSQGQKRQGEDVEELLAKAEEQHFDADVEVPTKKSWRAEDALGVRQTQRPNKFKHFTFKYRKIATETLHENDDYGKRASRTK